MTYIKKTKSKKDTKNKRCAIWILQTLNEYSGVIPFIELRYLGSQETEVYTRQDIYNAVSIIKDEIVRGGQGHMAIWYTIKKYNEIGKPNGSAGIIKYLDNHGYSTVSEFLKDNDFPKNIK